MKTKVLIVEDEPLAQQTLIGFAGKFAWLEVVGVAADGLTAIKKIETLKPSLVFLDVRIPEISGVEVLQRIAHKPFVVFTTAFDNYAITAFELEAIDYLQKPFGFERFRQTLQRVERLLEKDFSARDKEEKIEPVQRLFVRDRRGLIPLPVEKIIHLKSDDDYTIIFSEEGKFLVGTTLKELAAKLNRKDFVQVHRSAIVNLNYVKRIEEDSRRLILYLSNGEEIQASRTGSQTLKQLFA